jgi:hypothetical protein
MAPDHPAAVSVREDLLIEHARQFFATRILGPDRAAVLREQLSASAAEEAARREEDTDRRRVRLKQIDAAEDAHVREVQALADLDPNSPAVKAMRELHLRASTELEAERDQIGAKLTALARQAGDHGGDPALLDDLPMLGDVLPKLADRAKQQLFEALDLAMLYHKQDNQVTCRATITPHTSGALAALLARQDHPSGWHAPWSSQIAVISTCVRGSGGGRLRCWGERAAQDHRRRTAGPAGVRRPGAGGTPP